MSNFADGCQRVAIASCPVSLATVCFTYPQVTTLSKGLLPKANLLSLGGILKKSMASQWLLKAAQFLCLRELKLAMDGLSPNTSGLNTMLAYGITGVPAQSVLYNRLIADIFQYHNASKPSQLTGMEAAKDFFRKKNRPRHFLDVCEGMWGDGRGPGVGA
eukprot:NODE_4023_length_855_cov_12.057692_g3866_i0.p1 GENE.NODE_4023_length_855_cov_12.057692_g3866_i0~~NODE_4023_length_855_cov_12.057692_g3866_i0.p1  ORF type:complete len:174 (-),score=54.66 NODE_4023_length_855_cov_12.057692_g3866_i0:332-811(-)